MRMDSFKDIAKYCVERYKTSLDEESERYVGTLYVSIDEHDFVDCSTTPHILSNATECILIHECTSLSEHFHKVEYINEDGCVTDGNLTAVLSLKIDRICKNNNPSLSLKYDDDVLYRVYKPWADNIPKLWKLYSQLRDKTSEAEIKLIARLYRKDEDILRQKEEIEDFKFTNHLLEQERNQYKELLDEIKEALNKE